MSKEEKTMKQSATGWYLMGLSKELIIFKGNGIKRERII
jgi:glutamate synthase domain-containing protein 1